MDPLASPTNGGTQSPNVAQLMTQLKEVTSMFKTKADELTTVKQEFATVRTQYEAALAKIATLESVSSNGDASGLIKLKDDEIAALKSKTNDMIAKIDQLEGQAMFLQKKAEQAANKVTQEKDDEINSLKIMFTEVSEKRKESFLQLKERLKTASEMLTKNAEQQAQDHRTIEELTQKLDQTQRALKDKTAEVNDYVNRVHSLEHEKGDLFQRTSNELQQAKNELRDTQSKMEILSADCKKAQTKANFNEQKESFQNSVELSIEPVGGMSIENGRLLKLNHTFDPSSVQVQWFRSFKGSLFQPIPGRSLAQGPVYTPTVDDIGAILKAEVTVPGPGGVLIPISREIGPVGSKRQMVLTIHETIKKQEVTFTVDSAYDSGLAATGKKVEKPQILLNKEKIKLRSQGKTIAKAEWNDQLRVTLDTESATRFTVRVDAQSNPVSYAVPADQRDLVVQTIRSFMSAMISLANEKAKKQPVLPPDAVLALAYLIRTTNEGRNNVKRPMSVSSDEHPMMMQRQHSMSSHGSGPEGGASNPATPVVGGAGRERDRHGLSFSGEFEGGGVSASAKKADAPAVAVAKIKGSNGEELDIDADGFVIRKESGWGAMGASSTGAGGGEKKPKEPKGDGDDDSDFSADEDEGEAKPAFQMKINSEARPRASGADLRKSIVGFGLAMPLSAQAGVTPSADGKKKKKDKTGEKKEKTKRKKSVAGGEPENEAPQQQGNGAGHPDGEEDGIQLPLGVQQPPPAARDGEPSPSPSPVKRLPSSNSSASSSSASAAYAATAANAAPSAANDMAPDDLFAFLDSQQQAPPSLGGPTPKATQPQQASPPATSVSTSSSSATTARTATQPTPSPTALVPTSPGGPSVQSASYAPDDGVDILVMETIHARVMDGDIIEYAVWGEILLNISIPPPTARIFDFQIFNTEFMTKVAPNTAVLTGGQGAWRATIPAGTDQPLCVMKYKVATDLNQAKKQVPLKLNIAWQCSKQATVIDVDYALQPTTANKLIDLKFLIALTPEKCIKQCTTAVPKCMWSPQSQKMMWQLSNLPTEDTNVSSGRLHAELQNADIESQPAPLSVSFMSDDLESVISGILVTEGDKKDAKALPLGRLIYRVKSGIFTVL